MMIALSEQPRRPSKESGVDCTTVGKYRVSSFIETAAGGRSLNGGGGSGGEGGGKARVASCLNLCLTAL